MSIINERVDCVLESLKKKALFHDLLLKVVSVDSDRTRPNAVINRLKYEMGETRPLSEKQCSLGSSAS